MQRNSGTLTAVPELWSGATGPGNAMPMDPEFEPKPWQGLTAYGDSRCQHMRDWDRNGYPKIEVHRTVRGTPLLAREDTTIVAIATDTKFVDFERPIFGLDDIEAIAAFIRSLMMTR